MKKYVIFTLLTLFIAPIIAQPGEPQNNRFYLAPGIVAGSEIGFNGRIEYEKPNRGKIMYVSEIAVNDAFLFDNALGYGYPFQFGPNKALYANGYLSYMLYGGLGANWEGPTAMLEFEYRYCWKYCFVSLGAYYRQMVLFKKSSISTLNQHDENIAPAFGVRLNFGVYF